MRVGVSVVDKDGRVDDGKYELSRDGGERERMIIGIYECRGIMLRKEGCPKEVNPENEKVTGSPGKG